MAIIKSGDSVDELTIDPTKAARVAVYNDAGINVNRELNKYSLPILLNRISAAIAAGSYLFTIRNGSTKKLKLKKLVVSAGFDGTAAATTQLFELVRFSGGIPSGGTQITLPSQVSKKSSLQDASTLSDARYNVAAALTVTGVTFESGGILSFGVPRSVTNQCVQFDFDDLDIWLEPSEGFAIRATNATVVGDSIMGMVHWSEE